MNINYPIIFAILICSFIASKYFYTKDNPKVVYPKKDYFFFSYIIALVVWIVFIFNLLNPVICIVSFIVMFLVLLKEIILSIKKISYFDKEFKIILRKEDYNEDKDYLRRVMGMEAIKNIFYILAAPLLGLNFLINLILNKIF